MPRQLTQPTTAGAKLAAAREHLNLSLEEVVNDLGIPFKYLEALERNRPRDLPDREQAEKILRNYCNYLKINPADYWREIKKGFGLPGVKIISAVEKGYFRPWPRLIRRLVAAAVVAAVLIFLAFKVEQIFAPPVLEIYFPADESIVESKQITLTGRSEAEVELLVNNQEIFVDRDGNFTATVDLQKGLNLIKISAKKRYSRVQEKELRLLFKD